MSVRFCSPDPYSLAYFSAILDLLLTLSRIYHCLVSIAEKGDSSLELKELAIKLQEKRRTLLHDLKTGTQLVPSDLNNVKDDSKDSDSKLFAFIKELIYAPKLT